MRRWGTVLLLALLGVLALAPWVGAHALLRHSDPERGAVLQRTPEAVTITFTEQPEATLSVIRVLDSAGRSVSRGPAQIVPGQPLELKILLEPVPQGVYTVSWRTVSRVDGHVTGGAFAFGVGLSPATAPQAEATAPPPSPLAVIARWGVYAGLSGLLGAAWVWTSALGSLPRPPQGYLWLLWGISAAGVVALGVAQAADAGVGIIRLLGTSLGTALWWRALPLGVAGIAIAARALLPVQRRWIALAVVGAAAAGSMLAHVLAGHAGASTGAWRWANILIQWAHFSAVGTWIGGLGALLVALRGAPDALKAGAARQFSTVAAFAAAALAGTGILRAVDEVGAWEALLSTDFGRLVLLKAGLLVVLVALGAVNRYRSIPAAAKTLRGLRRVGGAELAVAVVVFGVTGVLVGLPPASLSQQATAPSPLEVSGVDFGTSVRVRLEITPGFPGPNRFIAHVVDYDTERPVAADRVTLRFTIPDRPDIGPSTLVLSRAADGTYQGQGTNLSLEGGWEVTVVIERGVESAEVPLTVATRRHPLRIRAITAPGQPTLYSIDLPGNRVLDAYLDPGRPGLNEVHATFIDAAGGELPIPHVATITIARPGQAPEALPVRRFGPGHFIGDAQLGPGNWQLHIAATTADGQVFQVDLPIRL